MRYGVVGSNNPCPPSPCLLRGPPGPFRVLSPVNGSGNELQLQHTEGTGLSRGNYLGFICRKELNRKKPGDVPNTNRERRRRQGDEHEDAAAAAAEQRAGLSDFSTRATLYDFPQSRSFHVPSKSVIRKSRSEMNSVASNYDGNVKKETTTCDPAAGRSFCSVLSGPDRVGVCDEERRSSALPPVGSERSQVAGGRAGAVGGVRGGWAGSKGGWRGGGAWL